MAGSQSYPFLGAATSSILLIIKIKTFNWGGGRYQHFSQTLQCYSFIVMYGSTTSIFLGLSSVGLAHQQSRFLLWYKWYLSPVSFNHYHLSLCDNYRNCQSFVCETEFSLHCPFMKCQAFWKVDSRAVRILRVEHALPSLLWQCQQNSDGGDSVSAATAAAASPGRPCHLKQICPHWLGTPRLQAAIYLSQIWNCTILGSELNSWQRHILLSACHGFWHPQAGRN